MTLSAIGEVFVQADPNCEDELVYVVEREDGRIQLLTSAEFCKLLNH
jgi:hypothetical protein